VAAPALAARLAKLRVAYLQQLPAQAEGIRRAWAALSQAGPEPETIAVLHRLLHTLKGGSASFGLADLAAAATTGEVLLKALGADPSVPWAAWRRRLEESLRELDRAFARVDTRPAPAVAEGEPVPSAAPEPEVRTVYLCEDDPAQAQTLAAQLRCFGFQVKAFQDLEAFRSAALANRPQAVVVDMVHPGRPLGGAETAAEILARHPVPVVFVSAQADLPTRLAAVRAGASAYVVKPVNAADLAAALNALTRKEEREPCRILIIDDDAILAEMNAAILQEVGMATRTVADPMATLPHLFEFRPDLILMDMHMPGCNGMELAKAIRQIDAFLGIPIVFLSSETDPDLQSDARRMGGDEFLVKPIKPGHLVAAVFPRAERMRLIRSQMIRDGMTGLLNHTAAKAFLDDTAARARRTGGEFCFAMIDLDHFKKINDAHGHPMGDRVLVALARLLRQGLRKVDVVGRYGGEEFAIILPGCALAKAAACMEQLRRRFSGIRFDTGTGEFTATFSCGVASCRQFPDPAELCQAADQALYRAKRGGRNRVEADGG
jgi:diguanylate cyclase (GGDEF)-like protein